MPLPLPGAEHQRLACAAAGGQRRAELLQREDEALQHPPRLPNPHGHHQQADERPQLSGELALSTRLSSTLGRSLT